MKGRKPQLVVDNAAPAKAPLAPQCLGNIGRTEWRKVAPILAENGFLPAETESLLVLYCQDAAKILKKQGRSLKGLNGIIKAHPMIRAEAVYLQNALRYSAELGLTAMAKARKSPRHDGPTSVLD